MSEVTTEQLTKLRKDIATGEICRASTEELSTYSTFICHPQMYANFGEREYIQVCETIRAQLVRSHIDKLQDHITSLNRKNSWLQWCVVALTVASLIGTAVQATVAVRSEVRVEKQLQATASQQQMQKTKESSAKKLPTP
jgi:hypothetical protein